ncbi:hypothetical protein EVAR_51765_1 [Eumeta japonica]|uniref:Uncharacterized protein n=1 Tax=Eumeta variegata TaxID=151549 RepID=A0A4C1XD34_EUMVA|nr:hypothetical protein EVAR_51765_1 [Eumeta japonica]
MVTHQGSNYLMTKRKMMVIALVQQSGRLGLWRAALKDLTDPFAPQTTGPEKVAGPARFTQDLLHKLSAFECTEI